MKINPFNLEFDLSNTTSYNGNISEGYHIGLFGPKGGIIHLFCCNLFISKDGVNYYVNKTYYNGFNIGYFLLARFIAILETILFGICLCIFIPIYLISIMFGLIFGILMLFTLPCEISCGCLCCCRNCMGIDIINNRHICQLCWVIVFTSIISIFMIIAHTLLIPFQILIPELTSLVLKQHKWNTTQFDYLN